MAHLERVGYLQASDRQLFVMEPAHPDEVACQLSVASPYFLCLLAWNAIDVPNEIVSAVAQRGARCGVRLCLLLGTGLQPSA